MISRITSLLITRYASCTMASTKTYPLSITGYFLRITLFMFPSPPNSTSLRNFAFSSQRMILYWDYKTYTHESAQSKPTK